MYNYYKKYVPYLFILPAGVFLAVFFFVPFIATIIMSFKDYSDIYNPRFCALAEYAALFKSEEFYGSLYNTFLFMLYVVPFLAVFPLIVAIFVNQKIKGASVYKLLIYLPVVVSIVAVAIAFKWLFAQQGILNYFVQNLGFSPIGWLTDNRYSLFSVALVTIYKGIGYYMMIYLAALTSVPKDLYEAAEIDGANEIQKHLTVTLPHIMPAIALVVVMSSISALKVFAEIYVMTKGGPLNSTKTMVYYIYERAFENLDLSAAAAASVVLLVIILIFSILNMTLFENKRYKL